MSPPITAPAPRSRHHARRALPAPARPASRKTSGGGGYVAHLPAGTPREALAPGADLVRGLERIETAFVSDAPICAPRPLLTMRGYLIEDLHAVLDIALELAYASQLEAARMLLEGLTTVAPKEGPFALALGFVHDRRGATSEAHAWYARAGQLAPRDPRADINRGELHLRARDLPRAERDFARGLEKARSAGHCALEEKARALHRHVREIMLGGERGEPSS